MIKSLIALVVAFALCVVIDRLKKKGTSFMIRILLATAMGAIVGLIFKGSTDYVAIFGRVFASLLQAFVIPLLLFSIITTVASLESSEKLRSMGGKTIIILALHNVLAAILSIILGKLVNIGMNANIKMDVADKVKEVPPFADVFVSFFPKNIIDSMSHNKIVPIVIFAIIIGIVVLRYTNKEEIKPFMDFVEAGNKVMNKVIGEIIEFTPYAVLSLLANQVATLDLSFVKSLLFLLLMVYVACLFHTFITTSAMMSLIAHINPFKFQRKFFPAWLIAFTTQSSIGSLPANIKEQEDMGVPTETASFAASIGTTFGMPGCAAVWPILLAMFTINALNIPFSATQYLIMVGSCLFASMGTVGVPGTGTIQATAIFATMGLPVEMILVLSPIQGVADMARTSTNVHAGGSTGVMVAAMQHDLDMEKYNA